MKRGGVVFHAIEVVLQGKDICHVLNRQGLALQEQADKVLESLSLVSTRPNINAMRVWPHIVKGSTIAEICGLLLGDGLGLHFQRLSLTNRGKSLLQVLDNGIVHADEV